MDKQRINSALNDLITRLRDAEKGYLEIQNSIDNNALKKWMKKYASERRAMRNALEALAIHYPGKVDNNGSILGDLHRMFIDIKLNHFSDDFDSIVNEIKRGAQVLLMDYRKILHEVPMDNNLRLTLENQRVLVEIELMELVKLKDELQSVEA